MRRCLSLLRATEGEIHGFWPYFSKNNVFDSYAKDVYVFLEKNIIDRHLRNLLWPKKRDLPGFHFMRKWPRT